MTVPSEPDSAESDEPGRHARTDDRHSQLQIVLGDGEMPASALPPQRSAFERWWLDGVERCLSPLHRSSDAAVTFAERHQLDVPPHIVQQTAAAIFHDGPQRWDPEDQPPVTAKEWEQLVVGRVRTTMEERDLRYRIALRAHARIRRPKSTFAILAQVVRDALSDQVVIDRDTAGTLVRRGREIFAAGPRIPGGWSIPAGIDAPIEGALFLIARFALELAAAQPSYDSPGMSMEPIAELLAECLPSAFETIEGWSLDRIGPLAFTHDGGPITARERSGPILLLGKPGSGKTQLLITMLATLVGGVVMTTTKPRDLLPWLRLRTGPIHLVNATSDITGLEGRAERRGFNPLSSIHNEADARQVADVLLRAQPSFMGGVNDDEFWSRKAIDAVWPFMLYAAKTGESLSKVYERVICVDDNVVEVVTWLEQHGYSLACASLVEYAHQEERLQTSVMATATALMAAYTDGLAGSLDSFEPLDWRSVIKNRETVILYSNDRTAAHTRSYYVSILDALITAAAELASEGWVGPKMNLLLDEAANCVPHPRLPSISSIAPGMGLNIVASFQDIAQLSRVWRDGGRELFGNAGTVLVYPGSVDPGLRELIGSLEPPRMIRDDDGTVVGVTSGAVLAPSAGQLIVVDEHGTTTRARQILAYQQPDLVAARTERAVVTHPDFRALLATQRLADRVATDHPLASSADERS